MKTRTLSLLVAAVVAAAVFGTVAAVADERRARDTDDTGGKLDIREATAGHSADGRLRHVISTYEAWKPVDLKVTSGPPPGFCVDIWTLRRPSSGPPDYLVCANAARRGEDLQAWVSRVSRRAGRTGVTTPAAVSRPNSRSVILRFSQRQIGRPSRYYWRAESLYRGAECSDPNGCYDTAPELQRVASHVLRPPVAQTGPAEEGL